MLRALTRVLEPLPRHVHFRVIHQAQRLQMHVPDPFGEGATLPEIAVRGLEPLAVRADHSQVVVGDGAPVLVAAVTVRRERALIVRQSFAQLALDVGDDPEILLDTGAQPTARSAQLQCPPERPAGVLQGARRQVQPAQRIERLRREYVVADLPGDVVALVAELSGPGGLAAVMSQHRQTPQRLRQEGARPLLLRRRDPGLVALNRVRDAPRALMLLRFVEQVGGSVRRGRGLRTAGLTRRWHSRKSAATGP